MDDFRASAPEQRGPANPNVESIPFEDMKERILKIVKGYNGQVPSNIHSTHFLSFAMSSTHNGLHSLHTGTVRHYLTDFVVGSWLLTWEQDMFETGLLGDNESVS